MSTMQSCLLCFNEFTKAESFSDCNSKLYNLCCTYLHSVVTNQPTDQSSVNKTFPLCPNCVESAMKLNDYLKQMKLLQKSIYDLIFLFSLEILHHREKKGNKESESSGNNSGNKYSEIDILALSNSYACPSPLLSVFKTCETDPLGEHQTDSKISETNDESIFETNDESISEINDESIFETNDESISETKEELISETRDESIFETNDESISETKDESIFETNYESISETKDESIFETNDESISETNDESNYETNDESNYETNDESNYETNDESNYETNDELISETNDESISETIDESISDPNLIKNESNFEVAFETIKYENYQEDCHDENLGHRNSGNTELQTCSAETDNCIAATPERINKQTPYLQLQRLQFQRNGEIAAMEGGTLNGNNDVPLNSIIFKTVWSKKGKGISYKIKERTEITSGNESNSEQESPLPSTSGTRTSNKKPEEQTAMDMDILNPSVGFTKRVLRSNTRNLKPQPVFADFSMKIQYQYDSGRSCRNINSSTETDNMRPYKCDFCNNRFKHRGSILTHRKHHIGERSFKCALCPQAFITDSSLSFHHRIEHPKMKEKPFVCRVCDRGFCNENTLRWHARIHTGEKPYHCNQCDYSSLKSHKRKGHTSIKCHKL